MQGTNRDGQGLTRTNTEAHGRSEPDKRGPLCGRPEGVFSVCAWAKSFSCANYGNLGKSRYGRRKKSLREEPRIARIDTAAEEDETGRDVLDRIYRINRIGKNG